MENGANTFLHDNRGSDYELSVTWFTSKLLDSFFPFNSGASVLNFPPGLFSTCNNHTEADIYFHFKYRCYKFFQQTPHKYVLTGTSQNGD